MDSRRLQAAFAYSAVVLLTCPALRPLEYSITFGDLFLLMAILLNVDCALKVHSFQLPLIVATPFMIVSQVVDTDATLIEVAQCVYIYGVILPFGWVAFARLRPRTLLVVFLIALAGNALVAFGQNMGYIGAIGRGRIWATRDTFRAAGLSITCSSLCMTLTPAFPLLLYVKSYRYRIFLMVAISLGILATLAKSAIFAIPGLIFYLIHEPNRKGVVRLGLVFATVSCCLYLYSPAVQWLVHDVAESISHRIGYLHVSLWERTSTLRFALSYVPECYLLGLGYAGTHYELTQHLGNTVHVFHVGLPLIGGLVCALLHYLGIILMIHQARRRQAPLVVFMIGQLLAVCTMPVLMHSFQYIPYMLTGAVVVASCSVRATRPAGQSVYSPATPLLASGASRA
ncbi:MAG: hypothetical protein VB858_11830 [Planctomycetaceae bacterium]